LHPSHFPGVKPDLDTTRVEGGFCQDVFHDACSQLPAPLILFLRDVYPQSWLDVFAIVAVHVLAAFTLRK
jgi:hypothetical protein